MLLLSGSPPHDFIGTTLYFCIVLIHLKKEAGCEMDKGLLWIRGRWLVGCLGGGGES